MAEVTNAMIEAIEGGKTLAQAMAEYENVYSEKYSLIWSKQANNPARLVKYLKSLAISLKWQDEQAALTKKLLTYPAFVGIVVGGVVVFSNDLSGAGIIKALLKRWEKELPIHTKVHY